MKKLLNVQKNLKVQKNQYNSFGKYKYRSCEDILQAAKPLCIENNLLLTLNDELVLIGDRYYIKASANIIDTETSERIEVTAYAREELAKKGMDGSQITGTASSYARKYALNGLFCIDDTKDADTDEFCNKQQSTKKESDFNRADAFVELKEKLAKANITEKQILAQYKHDTNKAISDVKFLPNNFLVAYIKLADNKIKEGDKK